MSSRASFYHTPYFVSSVVAHAIYELDIEDKVEVVIYGYNKMKDDFHLEKHPQGKIPFYTEGEEFTLIESSAILLYLLDKHDTEKKLTNFVDDRQRGKFYQYLLNCPTQIYPNFVTMYIHQELYPEVARNKDLLNDTYKIWNNEIAPYLVQQLGSNHYFLGDNFTAIDCLVGFQLVTAEILNVLSAYPTLQSYLGRLRARPAFAKLYSEENKCFLPTLERYTQANERKKEREASLLAKQQQQPSA
eukprot:gene12034-14075_t